MKTAFSLVFTMAIGLPIVLLLTEGYNPWIRGLTEVVNGFAGLTIADILWELTGNE